MSDIKTLADLRPDERNANRGTPRGRGLVETSLQKYGAGRSVLVDRNGKVIAGNKTTDAAAAAGMDDVLVVQSDGTRLVVVQRTDLDLDTDTAARELAIADNRAGELGLEWDADVLTELSQEIDLSTFWSKDEIGGLLEQEITSGGGGDEFDATPETGPTRTQYGQVWACGDHRVMCGDSTRQEDVDRLMQGDVAAAVVTDPPYGINRDGITNDDPEGLRELFTSCIETLPIENAIIVAFQSTRLFPEWLDAVRAAGHKFERMLWMYKPSDMTFPWRGWLLKSEAVLISSVGKPVWNEVHPFMHDTYSPTTIGKELPLGIGHHASVKPMEAVADIVQRVSADGSIVYDPFGGSGTTLVACERKGRVCRTIDIEPVNCDLILRRYEAETGLQAERIDG